MGGVNVASFGYDKGILGTKHSLLLGPGESRAREREWVKEVGPAVQIGHVMANHLLFYTG